MPAENDVSAPSESGVLSTQPVDLLYAGGLAAVTALSRVAFRGSLYFVDGPAIVNSIRAHTYVVQSPGYYALAHLGGLFHDPAFGLAFWNVLFSALGVAVLYLLLRQRQADRSVCLAAAIAYASVYFLWFAGEIHSSYASQLLFPSLSLLCFYRYKAKAKGGWLFFWALSAATGMAIRPSDGVFLLPLWAYLLVRYRRGAKAWLTFAAVNAAVFLAWYIPTRIGMQADHRLSTGSTIWISMQSSSLLLNGFNVHALANLSRVIIPALMALGPLFPALASERDRADNAIAAFWAIPGFCFFLFCYIADPTYLAFLSGAVFWLVATAYNKRRAYVSLLLCALLNAVLFLAARPVRGQGTAQTLVNFYVVKYCRYGIEHRWSSTVGGGAVVP